MVRGSGGTNASISGRQDGLDLIAADSAAAMSVYQVAVNEVCHVTDLLAWHVHISKAVRQVEPGDEARHPIGALARRIRRTSHLKRNIEGSCDRAETLGRHARHQPHRMRKRDARSDAVRNAPSG